MRGRPAKPTAVKRAEGNPGRRPLNEKEPSAGKRPKKPRGLDKISSRFWDEFCEMAQDMGVLDRADALAIELMARAYAEWRACDEFCKGHNGGFYTSKTASGGQIMRQFPQMAAGADAWRRLRSMLGEFGLTPSARVRLGGPGEQEDELSKLMAEFRANN